MIGLSFWLAISVMPCFYMMSIVLTWMVTNGRFLFLPAIFRPSDYLMIAFGSARFSDRDHTILPFDMPPSSHAVSERSHGVSRGLPQAASMGLEPYL